MDLWRILFVSKTNQNISSKRISLFSHLKDPQKTLESILSTKITLFPGHIQSVYYQNILKIITYIIQSSDNNETLAKELVSMTIDKMSVFLSSGDVEAQERVCLCFVIE
jgi:AP-3 complex subunit delta-1